MIVITRGGGSRADLSWFDQQALCEAIARCPVPVVTGIGHEIDRSLADEVAHTSCKTPTAVAELLVGRVRAADDRMRQAAAALAAATAAALQDAEARLAGDGPARRPRRARPARRPGPPAGTRGAARRPRGAAAGGGAAAPRHRGRRRAARCRAPAGSGRRADPLSCREAGPRIGASAAVRDRPPGAPGRQGAAARPRAAARARLHAHPRRFRTPPAGGRRPAARRPPAHAVRRWARGQHRDRGRRAAAPT